MPRGACEASSTRVTGAEAAQATPREPARAKSMASPTRMKKALRRTRPASNCGLTDLARALIGNSSGRQGRPCAGTNSARFFPSPLPRRSVVHVKIVVTVKLVPDPNAEKRIDPATKRLVRTGVETVLNPYDEYALEAALQLKERAGGDTTVTVFTMGPEGLKETLRKALAMGADEAVLLSDSGLEGSDV